MHNEVIALEGDAGLTRGCLVLPGALTWDESLPVYFGLDEIHCLGTANNIVRQPTGEIKADLALPTILLEENDLYGMPLRFQSQAINLVWDRDPIALRRGRLVSVHAYIFPGFPDRAIIPTQADPIKGIHHG